MSAPASLPGEAPGFRHEALLYDSDDAYVAGTVPFAREGLEAGEAVLVMAPPDRIAVLREALGRDSARVRFADMTALGRNPATILPAWSEFVSAHADGAGVRGIGEPVWPGRRADEVLECHQHELLLNLAFPNSPAFRLLCPYDRSALDPEAIAGAWASHPHVSESGARRASGTYTPGRSGLDLPLDQPPAGAAEMSFGPGTLASVRGFVRRESDRAGLDPDRTADIVLAVNEVATNTLRYAGGAGRVRAWPDDGSLVCEVSDHGKFAQPLVGRLQPPLGREGGRGMWIVNHLCDLVQLRSAAGRNVVRLRVAAGPR